VLGITSFLSSSFLGVSMKFLLNFGSLTAGDFLY
jgi:hypothetical protein